MSLQVPVVGDKKSVKKKRNSTSARKGGCGCLGGEESEEKRPKNLVAALLEHKDKFSTLISLATSADIVGTLQNAKNVTLFAPTNDAFTKLFKANPGLQEQLTNDTEELKDVLTAHVIPSDVSFSAPNFADGLTTLNPSAKITISSGSDQFSSGTYANGYPARSETIVTENESRLFIMDDVLVPNKRKAGACAGPNKRPASAGTRRSARLQRLEPDMKQPLSTTDDRKTAVASSSMKKRKGGANSKLAGLRTLLGVLEKEEKFAKFITWVKTDNNVTIMAPSTDVVNSFIEKNGTPSAKQVEALLRAHIIPQRMDATYLLALFNKVADNSEFGFSVPTAIVNKFVHMIFYKGDILYGTAKVADPNETLDGKPFDANNPSGPVVHVIDKVLNVLAGSAQIISLP